MTSCNGTHNYKLTNSPYIFKNSYWGSNINADSNIIENRNTFVQEFDIKRYNERLREHMTLLENQDTTTFDHVEIYNTMDGKLILISSPYGNHNHAKYEYYGFKLYNPLYKYNAITYLKEFDNLTAYKIWCQYHTLFKKHY